MIRTGGRIVVPERELHFTAVRASGPGGQNVNKVATAIQMRFDVGGSPSLAEDVRARLIALAGRRVSRDGVLTIDARRFRTQERNRQDAIERLRVLLEEAAAPPPPKRRPTRPGRGAKERRLSAKSRRATIKSGRGRPPRDTD